MQRGRQRRHYYVRSPPTRFHKRQLVVPANFIGNSAALIKIDQISAAAQQYVLTVVDNLARPRMLIRGCSPSQIRPPLKQRHSKTRIGQGASRGQSSQAATHDSDTWPIGR